MCEKLNKNEQQLLKDELSKFHGDGFFEWQRASDEHKKAWEEWHYDVDRY